jgi:protein-S-isoprenylcysteine O-methyltransferase
MLPTYAILEILLLVTELRLAISRRSAKGRESKSGADAGSLRLLWIVMSLAIAAGDVLARNGPFFEPARNWLWLGVGLFCGGLLWRSWAIGYLGRFFTVDVAIAKDHRVVDDGPYRWVRHPSYVGLILEYAGIGFALGSLLSWLVIMIPVLAVLLYRVRVEEKALSAALGEPYRIYQSRTWRLVPFVY